MTEPTPTSDFTVEPDPELTAARERRAETRAAVEALIEARRSRTDGRRPLLQNQNGTPA